MAEIENPWHSRPIDVHRWSDHPEVKALVDRIWDQYLPEEVVGRPGPKPKLSFRKQLRVVILDLYVAWLEDPALCIGVSMSVNHWKTNSRYNALHISKKIVPIIQALHEAELIDLSKGSYRGRSAQGNRTTRIRASITLRRWFREAKFAREDIGRAEGEELIILKDANNTQIEYEDTAETNGMRAELEAYNALIAGSFIDIPSLQNPVIELGGDEDEEVRRVSLESIRTRRVFSRSDWGMNGRFYGGWWQQIDSNWRSKITVDTEPTIEVDFQGLHVAMLYAEAGVELNHDPYELLEYKDSGYPMPLVRKLAKRLALTAINAKEKSAAYRAFRFGLRAGTAGKNMTNEGLDRMLEAFLNRNPCLRDYLFTDQGIRLMRKDSDITAFIHNHFTQKGVPVLSVHDSYLIDCRLVGELRQVMVDASEEVMGHPLLALPNLPGKPEFQPVTDHELQWYMYSKEQTACEGYVKRVLAYEERTGRSLGPYEEVPV